MVFDFLFPCHDKITLYNTTDCNYYSTIIPVIGQEERKELAVFIATGKINEKTQPDNFENLGQKRIFKEPRGVNKLASSRT